MTPRNQIFVYSGILAGTWSYLLFNVNRHYKFLENNPNPNPNLNQINNDATNATNANNANNDNTTSPYEILI